MSNGDWSEFNRLTLTDILEAREANHRHLVNLKNVIGTAVGKYLVRRTDPDYAHPRQKWSGPRNSPRTLANSGTTGESVPSVLVFVDTWQTPAEVKRDYFIPSRLYLSDGRVVPTCVVYAPSRPIENRPVAEHELSRDMLGGGYPVLSDVQGQLRVGSVGALVTDGHSVYGLTNRHVAGPAGQVASAMALGKLRRVGTAAGQSIRYLEFAKAFPDWAVSSGVMNLDAGLILLDRIDDWSSQVYGLGKVGPLADLHSGSLTLDLIDSPVRAFGGTAGPLRGAIRALFYRYRSVGGTEYLTDFLLGPRLGDDGIPTRHGDSGTLWFFDAPMGGDGVDSGNGDGGKKANPVGTYQPFAMQWGGTSFSDDTGQDRAQFALASNLSTILRELSVEIVSDWNVGPSETWGKMGHYQVAASACDLVSSPKLFKLLQANRDNIGLSDAERENKTFPTGGSDFIALADVPDLLWKQGGERGTREKPSHFADADEEFGGKTLLSMYVDDPTTLDKATWIQFYKDLKVTKSKMGSLPFRVQQFYEEMVKFVQQRKVPEYVAAAGILAHYVGDAAQPLHASRLHHGHNKEESGVHAQYETSMLNKFRREVVAGVNAQLNGFMIAETFTGSQAAAEATMDLIRFAAETMSPQRIIDAYLAARQTSNTNDAMWKALGDDTIVLISESALYLAEIWESAWLEGGGESIGLTHMKEIEQSKLRTLYRRESFVRSNYLEDM